MSKIPLNIDETESWENSIDKDKDPKFKYPIEFKNSLSKINLDKMLNVKIKIPTNKKKSIVKIVDTTKRNKKNKGLF